MIVRTTSKEPEKLADRFADEQVVDAGNSPGHETVFIGILFVSCTDPYKKRPSVTNGDEPFIVPPILPRRQHLLRILETLALNPRHTGQFVRNWICATALNAKTLVNH